MTFQLLYCFFVIEHGRRRILRFNVTDHPTAEWVVQQLRDAFPEAGPYRYAIFDRDSTFSEDVVAFLEATGLQPKRTSVQAPWQNVRRSANRNMRDAGLPQPMRMKIMGHKTASMDRRYGIVDLTDIQIARELLAKKRCKESAKTDLDDTRKENCSRR